MDIKIIKQTDDYLVLNKPAGISVHGDGKTEQYTLVDWLLENFPQTKGVGEDLVVERSDPASARLHGARKREARRIEKSGIVHRLDKETSGVILIALNQKTYEHFKKQFKEREIKKVYHAFAYGNIKDDIFTVNEPIGKDRKDFRKRTTKNPRGKVREAVTNFRILNRGKEDGQLFVFVEARPKTGRMHQIRVHLKNKNAPIVCDHLYAHGKKSILGFKRMALHARKLYFKDLNNVEQEVEAPYSADFENAISKLNI
jgi:RluA family pseudouridine synthase